MLHLTILLLGYLLNAIDLHLSHVDFILVLLNLNLGLVVDFLL